MIDLGKIKALIEEISAHTNLDKVIWTVGNIRILIADIEKLKTATSSAEKISAVLDLLPALEKLAADLESYLPAEAGK